VSAKRIFASPQDVEVAFYEALERSDLAGMMAVWAEDEDIVCIHPGGPRLVGYASVRDAWRRIFQSGTRLEVRILQRSAIATPFAVIHSLIEQILVRDDGQLKTAPVAATNVYQRGAMGWRMVVHHGSPMPPDSLVEVPKVLH
jgi:ketosteroid isomerase-like protein